MTKQEYERWKDFALRMARTCWHCGTRPSKKWVVEKIKDFFWRNFEKYDGTPDESSIVPVIDWDSSECEDRPGLNYPVCDLLSMWSDEFNPWSSAEDGTREEKAYYRFDEQWVDPVRCCVRAGLDLAAEPSGGVVGFTAGDIRKMYPEGVPEWIKEGWWGYDEEPVQWDDIPDEQSLWL